MSKRRRSAPIVTGKAQVWGQKDPSEVVAIPVHCFCADCKEETQLGLFGDGPWGEMMFREKGWDFVRLLQGNLGFACPECAPETLGTLGIRSLKVKKSEP